MFDIMAAAVHNFTPCCDFNPNISFQNELLLDRLVLICSTIILNHLSLTNACFILSDATYLHAEQLIERLQTHMTINMELFLTTGMLNDIPNYLVKHLALYARQKQEEKSPVSRSNRLALDAMVIHADWLALQDIPHPIPRTSVSMRQRSTTVNPTPTGASPLPSMTFVGDMSQSSPTAHPQRIRRPEPTEDIFAMDEADVAPSLVEAAPRLPVWKSPSKPRYVNSAAVVKEINYLSLKLSVDMMAVMAEAAQASAPKNSRARESIPVLQGNSKSYNDLRSAGDSGSSPRLARTSLTSSSRFTQDVSAHASASSDAATTFPSLGASYTKPPNPTPKPRVSQTPPRPSGISLGMGPVITPTRQSSSSSNPYASTIRRAS